MNSPLPSWRSFCRSLGPAIVVASVVIGPGSILASSKVGAEYGYSAAWVLALSGALMMAMVGLAMRAGIGLNRTPCAELADRLGRPCSVLIGVVVFLIVTCFQVGNNTAVLSTFQHSPANAPAAFPGRTIIGLLTLNGLVVASLFGLHSLYRTVERLMMLLVLAMLVAFAGNLLYLRPHPGDLLLGLLPPFPSQLPAGLIPFRQGTSIVDPLAGVTALVATTLSVAGAFYQAYLVREKGWTQQDLRKGAQDTVAGILVLSAISLAILFTSATVLHGHVAPAELRTPSDVARQLQPMFGPAAQGLFSLGLFAAAFSSFLVNALIGGTVLADGCGLEPSMRSRWVKIFTTLALTLGMVLAITLECTGSSPVQVILLAQALTILGLPALALAILFLATRPEVKRTRPVPGWLLGMGVLCLLCTLLLAARKAYEFWLRWSPP